MKDALLVLAGGLLVLTTVLTTKGCGGEQQFYEIALKKSYFGKEVVAILDPCGDVVDRVDEKVIKLSNGKFARTMPGALWGDQAALIEPGTYVTGDELRCKYTLEADFTFSRECTVPEQANIDTYVCP